MKKPGEGQDWVNPGFDPDVGTDFRLNQSQHSCAVVPFVVPVKQPYLTGVHSSFQVSCTDHPWGDEALVDLWLVAGLGRDERYCGRAQNQTGLSWKPDKKQSTLEGWHQEVSSYFCPRYKHWAGLTSTDQFQFQLLTQSVSSNCLFVLVSQPPDPESSKSSKMSWTVKWF